MEEKSFPNVGIALQAYAPEGEVLQHAEDILPMYSTPDVACIGLWRFVINNPTSCRLPQNIYLTTLDINGDLAQNLNDQDARNTFLSSLIGPAGFPGIRILPTCFEGHITLLVFAYDENGILNIVEINSQSFENAGDRAAQLGGILGCEIYQINTCTQGIATAQGGFNTNNNCGGATALMLGALLSRPDIISQEKFFSKDELRQMMQVAAGNEANSIRTTDYFELHNAFKAEYTKYCEDSTNDKSFYMDLLSKITPYRPNIVTPNDQQSEPDNLPSADTLDRPDESSDRNRSFFSSNKGFSLSLLIIISCFGVGYLLYGNPLGYINGVISYMSM